MRKLFRSQLLLNFAAALTLLLAALFLLTIPWPKVWRLPLLQLLDEYLWVAPLFGAVILLFAVRLLVSLSQLLRHGSFEIVKGSMQMSVDEGVVEAYLIELLQKECEHCSAKVYVKDNQLYLMAIVEESALTSNLADRLRKELHEKLGYTNNFSLEIIPIRK